MAMTVSPDKQTLKSILPSPQYTDYFPIIFGNEYHRSSDDSRDLFSMGFLWRPRIQEGPQEQLSLFGRGEGEVELAERIGNELANTLRVGLAIMADCNHAPSLCE